jgi:hypothetical protein
VADEASGLYLYGDICINNGLGNGLGESDGESDGKL